jgi:hypothetical protein
LIKTFELTKEDVSKDNYLMLRMACVMKHKKVVKWLMENFNLFDENVITNRKLIMHVYGSCNKCFNIIICCLRDDKYMEELFGFVDKNESLVLNELTEIERNEYIKYKNNKRLMEELLIVDLTKIVYGYTSVF